MQRLQVPAKSIKPPTAKLQKIADHSNPHRIRVDLPNPVHGPLHVDGDQRSAKRVKLTGRGGINALLPAPKRLQPVADTDKQASKGRGLGKGVSLKTGAAPGFSRDPVAQPERPVEWTEDSSLSLPTETEVSDVLEHLVPDVSIAKPTLHGNARVFRPLSVARKPMKKKPRANGETPAVVMPSPLVGTGPEQSIKKSGFSLFSVEAPDVNEPDSANLTTEYQPMMCSGPDVDATNSAAHIIAENKADDEAGQPQPAVAAGRSGAESLDSIANDLNLSASARRQLFGRSGKAGAGSASAISVVNFNTDKEYAANEILRQSGETPEQVHNPVRAINAAGKTSLRQLVSAVSNQKDAYEEHFAKGRQGKKEAGARYGW